MIARPGGETADWWFRAGAIAAHQRRDGGMAPARNLILFVGDGMSLPTVAAARMLAGQRSGQPGEETRLSFEDLPYTALARTYNTDSQTPDSAGTMTALMTGAKTRIGMLSVAQSAVRGDCASARGAGLATLLELSEAAGLSTGVVTTTRLTHATPAAAYAHASERGWENDSDMPAAALAAGCTDIARQWVEFPVGDGIEVALGGGRSQFLPRAPAQAADPQRAGWRNDGRDLIAQWQGRYPEGRYVRDAAELAAVDPDRSPRLLGLFAPDHMAYEHDRGRGAAGEPSLAQMTAAALRVLKKNRNGYLRVVEGGRIDHAHHAGNAYRALDETIAFADAVRVAMESAGDDTLVVVTADHSHTLSLGGYPRRGNPILGKVVGRSNEDDEPSFAEDALGLPFTTLSYANGPGYAGASELQPEGPKRFPHQPRKVAPATSHPDLRDVDTQSPDFLQPAYFPLRSQTHGSDDVGVWASGPGASAMRGSLEQNVVFHVMLQAQPALVALLCRMGACEQGVPVRRPSLDALLQATPTGGTTRR